MPSGMRFNARMPKFNTSLSFGSRGGTQPVRADHLARVPIDVARRAPTRELRCRPGALGAAIEWLPPLDHQPDAVFVEDTASFPEVAVLTWRVSVRAKRGCFRRPALAGYGSCGRSAPPDFFDGATAASRTPLLVGLSKPHQRAGAAALRDAIAEFGYDVSAVHVRGALHSRAPVRQSPMTGRSQPRGYRCHVARGLAIIEVDERESRVRPTRSRSRRDAGERRFPRTEERLRGAGVSTRASSLRLESRIRLTA